MYVHVRVTITTWWYDWVLWSWNFDLVMCSYVYISPTSNYHDYHVIDWDAHPRKKLMGMGLSLLLSTNAIDSFGRENIRSSIHESASWTNMEAKSKQMLDVCKLQYLQWHTLEPMYWASGSAGSFSWKSPNSCRWVFFEVKRTKTGWLPSGKRLHSY